MCFWCALGEDLLELFQYNVALMDVEEEVQLTNYLLDLITDSEVGPPTGTTPPIQPTSI